MSRMGHIYFISNVLPLSPIVSRLPTSGGIDLFHGNKKQNITFTNGLICLFKQYRGRPINLWAEIEANI